MLPKLSNAPRLNVETACRLDPVGRLRTELPTSILITELATTEKKVSIDGKA